MVNKLFTKRNAPGLLWAFFILVLCGFPGNQLPSDAFFEGLDKPVHAFLFFVLTVLWARSARDKEGVARRSWVLLAAIYSIVYGIVVELLQAFVFIERSMDVDDMIANGIGAVLGGFLYFGFSESLEAKGLVTVFGSEFVVNRNKRPKRPFLGLKLNRLFAFADRRNYEK